MHLFGGVYCSTRGDYCDWWAGEHCGSGAGYKRTLIVRGDRIQVFKSCDILELFLALVGLIFSYIKQKIKDLQQNTSRSLTFCLNSYVRP